MCLCHCLVQTLLLWQRVLESRRFEDRNLDRCGKILDCITTNTVCGEQTTGCLERLYKSSLVWDQPEVHSQTFLVPHVPPIIIPVWVQAWDLQHAGWAFKDLLLFFSWRRGWERFRKRWFQWCNPTSCATDTSVLHIAAVRWGGSQTFYIIIIIIILFGENPGLVHPKKENSIIDFLTGFPPNLLLSGTASWCQTQQM